MKTTCISAMLPLAMALPMLASAQSIIQRSNTPYVSQPEIRFSIAGSAPTTALAEVKSVQSKPVGYLLRGGEPIHTELVEWAKRDGWELYWTHRASWRTRDISCP